MCDRARVSQNRLFVCARNLAGCVQVGSGVGLWHGIRFKEANPSGSRPRAIATPELMWGPSSRQCLVVLMMMRTLGQ